MPRSPTSTTSTPRGFPASPPAASTTSILTRPSRDRRGPSWRTPFNTPATLRSASRLARLLPPSGWETLARRAVETVRLWKDYFLVVIPRSEATRDTPSTIWRRPRTSFFLIFIVRVSSRVGDDPDERAVSEERGVRRGGRHRSRAPS